MGSCGLKWGEVERIPTLVGEYEHTIDDKNRLTLPARFREAFKDGLVITRGMDGCLYVHPRESWRRLAESIRALDDLDPDSRTMRRFFFSGASEDTPDKQGRIAVPSRLAETAGLKREVVIAGVADRLEIWDRKAWQQQLKQVEGSAEDVAQRLAAARH